MSPFHRSSSSCGGKSMATCKLCGVEVVWTIGCKLYDGKPHDLWAAVERTEFGYTTLCGWNVVMKMDSFHEVDKLETLADYVREELA